MTAVMTDPDHSTDQDTNAYAGPRCQRCDGPCATYKGSKHGWTCTACIERYLDEKARRWAVKLAKEREKVAQNMRNMVRDNTIDNRTPVSADTEVRSGQRYVPRSRPGGCPADAPRDQREDT